MMATIPDALNLALQHHQAGRLPEAEALYRQVLQAHPDHHEALHRLGLVAHQAGRHDDAVEYIGMALRLNPGVAEYHNNIGTVYRALGKLEEAAVHYRQALALRPAYAMAHNNLGGTLSEQGKLEEAVVQYRQALALQPAYAEACNSLGNALRAQGKMEEAVVQYRQALVFQPAYAMAHNNLGNALKEQFKLDEAVAHYRQALALQPALAEACYNLGNTLKEQGKLEEAIVQYRQTLALRPAYAMAHNNLGNALKEQFKLDEAVAHYRQALAVQPEYADAYSNLGIVLFNQGKFGEAAVQARQALVLKPDFVEAHVNLGNALIEQGKLEESVVHYRRALALKPDDGGTENQLMHQLQRLCEWSGLDDLFDRQKELARGKCHADISPFTLLSIPSSPAEQLVCTRNRATSRLSSFALLRAQLGFSFSRVPKPRLRIGYLSGDFCLHAVACLIAELFELHDRQAFEVYAYSCGPDDGSVMRKRLARACDRFVDVRAMSFQEAACQIYKDRIDVLVDLQGYTKGARTEIVALQPAPIQVNWLGYPGTMGAECIDYIVTDQFITPPGHEPFFSEKFVYLPDCYQVNDRKRKISPNTSTRRMLRLPADGFVFCCFNNTYKITSTVFDVWMRLLKKTPGSVLWLLESNSGAVANLRREAKVRKVSPERLVFAPKVSMEKHLARFRLAGLFLDTMPYNAHTTASDALWAGLPVLTCAGETFASRVAGSLLRAVGLPELITHSLAEYEAVALRLAHDLSELAGLRRRLAKNRLTTPLFDSKRFTRHLEKAYCMMWEWYVSGEPPQHIEVPALPPQKNGSAKRRTTRTV